MEFLNVGKIVNTFGIKGELKIVSRFEMPEKVFVKGNVTGDRMGIYIVDYVFINFICRIKIMFFHK